MTHVFINKLDYDCFRPQAIIEIFTLLLSYFVLDSWGKTSAKY